MKQTGIKIIKKLRDAGHEAVFAGGCVRDMIMGNEPNDWDIATSALPKEVEKLFDRTLAIGKSFGVINVIENDYQFEVATFRSDFDYDGRRPGKVKFVSMEQDALRRDFTINGIFYDPINKKIIDFIDGKKDIDNKIIRFIGKPEDRINEDYLRMIRAIRFVDRFEFDIEDESLLAIRRNSFKIQNISKERIKDEIVKTFKFGYGKNFLYYLLSTLSTFIIPELNDLLFCFQDKNCHPEGTVYYHLLDGFEYLKDENYLLKLGWLFHDIAKPQTYKKIDNKITNYGHAEIGAEMTKLILRRLTFSNDIIDYISNLVRDHMKFHTMNKMKKSTFRKLAGQAYFEDLLKLHRIDCLASNGDLTNYNLVIDKLADLRNEPILPKPLINGRDLIAIGFAEGREIGEIKSLIYDRQLEGEIHNFENALAMAKHIYQERNGIPL